MRLGYLCSGALLLASLAALAAIAPAEQDPPPGQEPNANDQEAPKLCDLEGEIGLELKGVKLSDLTPLVAYLDAVEGSLKYKVPPAASITQKDARFVPNVLVIAKGQEVKMPNDDDIYHNVFSYSRPNEFDLGIYRSGESKSVTFEHSGVVNIYCAIHSSMDGVIFVAPSPYHDLASSSGAFSLRNVPEGKYVLRLWGPKIPELASQVELVHDRPNKARIVLRESDFEAKSGDD